MLQRAPDVHEPALRAKFGGLPWGLSEARWPACQECGDPMSCLAQIPVGGHLDGAGPLAGRADLSDRVLHVFTCDRSLVCSFWEPQGGANSAFFLRLDELRPSGPDAAVRTPPSCRRYGSGAGSRTTTRCRTQWPRTSWITAAFTPYRPSCSSPVISRQACGTKLGGVPYWTGNGPSDAPSDIVLQSFRLLMQVDKYLMVEGGDSVDLANFCSDGNGFLFVDPDDAKLPALFAINR